MPKGRVRRRSAAIMLAVLAALGPLSAAGVSAQELKPAQRPDALQGSLRNLSSYSMLELEVVTADGANLGQVYDVIVDPTDGVLKQLVVERDSTVFGVDFPFVGTRAAVPWHRVAIQESPRLFRLDMSLDEVEQLAEWEGSRTEGAALGAAPIGERPDVPAQQ